MVPSFVQIPPLCRPFRRLCMHCDACIAPRINADTLEVSGKAGSSPTSAPVKALILFIACNQMRGRPNDKDAPGITPGIAEQFHRPLKHKLRCVGEASRSPCLLSRQRPHQL